ncbi:MAG: hypothetical protein HY077_12505 [Elusimicrobia bacterium]|nr:hypothetical protein [Elusimicrobiota bacterium]
MTTVKDIEQRFVSGLRRWLAVAAALALVLESAQPALAQRRKAEPEANPAFQQQLKAPAGGEGGAPIGEPAAAPAAGEDVGVGGDAGNVQGIQIGTTPPAKVAAPTSGSPLDARVTVRVKGAPLATFLDTISAQAKINFIITEGLEAKRVTAFLQNVTVREALQVLLEIKGLSYQQIGKSNTYIVTPRSKQVENLITRIYTLSYIPLIPLESAASSAGGGGGGGAAAAPLGAAPTTSVAIISVLQSILSKLGQVATDPRTNSLIVTDVPEVFPQIEQIIAELDKKAPQIMIEAQIVEINSERTKELGIDWGGVHGELASFTGGLRTTTFPLRMPNDLGKLRFLDPLLNEVTSAGPATGNPFTGRIQDGAKPQGLDLTQLSVAVRALVVRAEGRFLGKPKILTLNNKPAVVQITRQQSVSLQTTQGGAAAGGFSGSSAERQRTGVQLTVTPQVNKDGYITLLLEPRFTDIQRSRLNADVFDPITRSASTLVRIKNGQTLVLAGLLQSTESKTIRKVPFFGYIPLLGWLFSSNSSDRTNTDLVIFITPTIVND